MLCVFSNQVKWLVKRHEIIASHDRSPKIIGFLQKRGVVYRRRMCYTQSMEQLWTLLLLGRVWGRHVPTRSTSETHERCRSVVPEEHRIFKNWKFVATGRFLPSTAALKTHFQQMFPNCYDAKISRDGSAHVWGSPFAPNAVPAPVCAAALTKSRYHVRSAHEIFKVRFP